MRRKPNIRKIAKRTQKIVRELEKKYRADSPILYDAKSELLIAMEEFTGMLEFSMALINEGAYDHDTYEELKAQSRQKALLTIGVIPFAYEEEDDE